jgi:acyl transferase domain-containing protein/acyl carrier protein
MGLRFPGGAHDPDSLWNLLLAGTDAIVDVPPDRWDVGRFYDPDPQKPGKTFVRQAGFIDQPLDLFDAAFFGMSPREAAHLDPQQRLLLEAAWEALEDAGVPPEKLAASRTGVFIGGFTQDSATAHLSIGNRHGIAAHTATGASATMLAARLSYALDLRGPCLTIDTACSSSLVATHLACASLRHGECSAALVGGVSVLLRPEMFISMSKGGFLSPDARCKAFDARADGYARAEGVAVVLLKPLDEALGAGDRVYAVIRGTGSNQDGRTAGITVPSLDAQIALLREVYATSGVDPRRVQYIEAHGTGTPVGDPIEARALGEVLGTGRAAPCWLGSIKTNVGHLEAASGVAGLIKAALCLERRQIPRNLHFERPNEAIAFDALGLRVPVRTEPLPEPEPAVAACVNSFGYGGSNAHVVLEQAPRAPAASEGGGAGPWLVTVSGRSEAARRAALEQWGRWLQQPPAGLSLRDVAYSAGTRRSHHLHRAALVVSSLAELREKLAAAAADRAVPGVFAGRAEYGNGARAIFVFTGMGPQSWGMGRELLAEEATFRRAAEECDERFVALGAGSVLAQLGAAEAESRVAEPDVAQRANFLLQVALAELLRSWGVAPDAVIGHSAGEAAAALVAGALSLDDAVRVCHHRARLQARGAGAGKMLAVEAPLASVEAWLRRWDGRLCVAAVNAPDAVTISGDAAAVDELARTLAADEVPARELRGSVAYHSPHMDPLRVELEAALQALRPRPARIPLYSTALGARVTGDELDARYWWRNVRDPVRFADAMEQLQAGAHEIFVEIGPHPVLSAAIARCALRRGRTATTVPSLHRHKPERATLLAAVAQLHVGGRAVDLAALSGGGRFVRLPTYPWQREKHWSETFVARADRLADGRDPLLGHAVPGAQPTWESDASSVALPYLRDHRVEGEVVFPAACHVELALALHREHHGGGPCAVQGLEIRKALLVPESGVTLLQVTLDAETRTFQVFGAVARDEPFWQRHASGRLLELPPVAQVEPRPGRFRHACDEVVDVEATYAALARRGLQYGPRFRALKRLARGNERSVWAEVELAAEPRAREHPRGLHPVVIDACFQAMAAVSDPPGPLDAYLPVAMREIRCFAPSPARVFVGGRVVEQTENAVEWDIRIWDQSDNLVAELTGVRAELLPRAAVADAAPWRRQLYQGVWEDAPAPVVSARPGDTWVLLCDRGGLGARLDAALQSRGAATVCVGMGAELPDLESMFRTLAQTIPAPSGVVSLFALDEPRDPAGIEKCSCVAHVLRALERTRWDSPPRLWLVTRGAQRVDEADRVEGLDQSPLWGLATVAANEHPELECSIVDLDPTTADAGVAELADELLGDGAEREIAFRRGRRAVARLRRTDAETLARGRIVDTGTVPVRLEVGTRGILSSLRFREVERPGPGQGEVEIEIHAASVNFKDVGKALGALSPEHQEGTRTGHRLGAECAGIVTALGAGVEHVRAGDRVIAIVGGTFASHVVAPAQHVMAIPSRLTFAQGASWLVYMTAQHALVHAARLAPGERLLLHAASGGVGLACIQIARRVGAEIFAVAGNEEKRAYLRSLGIPHVMSSRSSSFVEEIRAATGGAGVDVVVSSLAGEMLTHSLGVLAPFGRFVELAYWGLDRSTRLDPRILPRNVTLVGVDLDTMLVERGAYAAELMREVARGFEEHTLEPLPTRVFPAAEAQQAFQHVSESAHIGKVVLDMARQRVPVEVSMHRAVLRDDATYLVTGGLGGLGLLVARWMVEQGARHLVLVGRSGAATAQAEAAVAALRAAGARVDVARADVSESAEVERVLGAIRDDLPPLRGIIHGAAAFDDAFLSRTEPGSLRAAMGAKALGAWHLHRQTEGMPLDFFVLFSSPTALIGAAGTGAYSASNRFLDALAHHRRALQLPATSVAWGPVADVGVAARDRRIATGLAQLGFDPMPPAEVLATLDLILRSAPAHVYAARARWPQFSRTNRTLAATPLWSAFLEREIRAGTSGPADGSFRDALLAARKEERESLLRARVHHLAARVFNTDVARVDVDASLEQVGLDSLLATELRARIEVETGIAVPVLKLMQRLSITSLTRTILDSLPAVGASAAHPAPPQGALQEALAELRTDPAHVAVAEPVLDATGRRLSARLIIDPDNPFFFDHPYDHAPGILLAEGALQAAQLVARSRCGLRAADEHARRFAISFARFVDLAAAATIEAVLESAGDGAARVRGRLVQGDSTVCEVVVELAGGSPVGADGGDRPAAGSIPDGPSVHKARPENIFVELVDAERRVCRLRAPPPGHCMADAHAGHPSPVYLLDAVRQASTLLGHSRQGLPREARLILISAEAEIDAPIARDAVLALVLVPPRFERLELGGMIEARAELAVGDRPIGRLAFTSQIVDAPTYARLRAGPASRRTAPAGAAEAP